MGKESYELGKQGEEIAANYLIRLGYEILERNYHSQQGELDLIARHKNFLVFVEVKSYSYRSYGSPVGAVRRAKKQSLIHAAQTYLYRHEINNTFSRFDVITIYKKFDGSQVIEHYQDAFYVS
jgi:putative endonuclease